MGRLTGAAQRGHWEPGCGMAGDGLQISPVTAGRAVFLFPATVQTTHSDRAESYLLCMIKFYLLFC